MGPTNLSVSYPEPVQLGFYRPHFLGGADEYRLISQRNALCTRFGNLACDMPSLRPFVPHN
ncbi:hypothetical protein BF49_4707 [Bradyrhizobium sp.]|jgi:hypothetical protein|nr:hypothetical protein BF49_4707 [Bradyrhizobium sp.]